MTDDRKLPVLGSAASDAGACGCSHGAHGAHGSGPRYWRSLEERAAGGLEPTPEFPDGADEPPAGWSRRSFVKLLGASAALAGLQACEKPAGHVIPYVNRPPEVVPGVPLDYATTMTLDGYGFGLLAQSREGRPIKLEGNPDHPASLGSSGVFEQASLLQLYDPHRGRSIRQGRLVRSWDHLLRLLGQSGEAIIAPPDDRPPIGAAGGRGLRFLMEPTASPFRIHWIQAIRQRFPEARFTFFAPAASTADVDAARQVFGQSLVPRYDFRTADVVVALDANFLDEGPFRVRYARDFADARRIDSPRGSMNRLYATEPALSSTGATADHHLAARASEIEILATWLVRAVEDPQADLGELREPARDWVRFAARDLRRNRGRSVVLAGPAMPPEVHGLTYLLNERLGNIGSTVRFLPPQRHEADGASHTLESLVDEMGAGSVETLVILDSNPVYSAPADLAFAETLAQVPRTLALALHENETARACEWYIPATHYLEAWGDARAYDGTISTIQPLIAPLFDGHSVDELLMAFAGQTHGPTHEQLKSVWQSDIHPRYGGGKDFDSFWKETLRSGVVPGSAAPTVRPTATAGAAAALADAIRQRRTAQLRAVELATQEQGPESPGSTPAPDDTGEETRTGAPLGVVEVAIRTDPRVYDGRFANNAWLLELPDPVTKLTWENAALLAPATADRLGIRSGDVVRITAGRRSLEIPAFPVPGHASDAVTLRLGYGREGAEETAAGFGVSVYRLRTLDAQHLIAGATLRPVLGLTGHAQRVELADTQVHWSMEGRPIVLEHTLEEYRGEPDFTREQRGPVPTLYTGKPLDAADQWAMTIDLAVCTGCSACVAACQAENNVPVVGKEGVSNRREMQWIRIDRYLTGTPEEPDVVFQPMLCQQCEMAPCEYVCPVNATVHSDDGLNEMVYNRCVGTRFCSNNCGWKVRRFNWFDYNQDRTDIESLVLNPDVTVRERGVMEKCTYCVQRIRRAQRQARIDGRELRRDEVRTACQQACPTQAIVFGSLTDPGSAVSRSRQQPRIYEVLHELGTKPRTQYLARITNPDPEYRARREQRRQRSEEAS